MAVYGSNSEKRIQIPVTGCSITATTTAGTIVIPSGRSGYLDINSCFGMITTAIATGTTGTIIITHTPDAGTGTIYTVGTYTAATTDGLGDMILFSPGSGYERGANVVAGDILNVKTLADASTTAVGTATAYVVLDLYST